MKVVFTCLLGVLLLGAFACSSHKSKPVEKAAQIGPSDEDDDLEAATPAKSKGTVKAAPNLEVEELRPLDFSPDGFPRIKKYFRTDSTTSNQVLERIETDFNGDGRVDFIQWYDSTGTWVEKDAADLNGDGQIDVVSQYKKTVAKEAPELVLQKFTTPRSRETNLWKYYRNGAMNMRAIDRNLDGKPDYWEHYEKGKLVRVDVDTDGDGNPDNQAPFPQVVKPKGLKPEVR